MLVSECLQSKGSKNHLPVAVLAMLTVNKKQKGYSFIPPPSFLSFSSASYWQNQPGRQLERESEHCDLLILTTGENKLKMSVYQVPTGMTCTSSGLSTVNM